MAKQFNCLKRYQQAVTLQYGSPASNLTNKVEEKVENKHLNLDKLLNYFLLPTSVSYAKTIVLILLGLMFILLNRGKCSLDPSSFSGEVFPKSLRVKILHFPVFFVTSPSVTSTGCKQRTVSCSFPKGEPPILVPWIYEDGYLLPVKIRSGFTNKHKTATKYFQQTKFVSFKNN